jgi:hypothetical protein
MVSESLQELVGWIVIVLANGEAIKPSVLLLA